MSILIWYSFLTLLHLFFYSREINLFTTIIVPHETFKLKNKKARIVSSPSPIKISITKYWLSSKNSILPDPNFQIKFFPEHKLVSPTTIMLYIYQRDTCHALPNRTISRHRCLPAYPSPSRWGGDRRRRKTNETVVVPNETRNLSATQRRRPSFHGRARKEAESERPRVRTRGQHVHRPL